MKHLIQDKYQRVNAQFLASSRYDKRAPLKRHDDFSSQPEIQRKVSYTYLKDGGQFDSNLDLKFQKSFCRRNLPLPLFSSVRVPYKD